MQTPEPMDLPPLWPRGPVPAGTYEASIVGAYLDNFSPNPILALTWMVSEGEYRGRRVFDWLPLEGEVKPTGFGYGKFLAIARAIGHPSPESIKNSDELHGRPGLIRVETVELEDEPVNEVRGYAPLGDSKYYHSGDYYSGD